jgi:hypothetical protein
MSQTHLDSLRHQRGQAIAEYSIILVGLTFAVAGPIIDGKSFMHLMIEAYQNYYTAFYFVLGLPFP